MVDRCLANTATDGRGELLPVMYSPDAIAAIEAVKGVFDPADVLNPGVVVRPRAVDDDLRRPAAQPMPPARRPGGYALVHDDGDLTKAVHRCVGVGKCRADLTAAGGFMCPSYSPPAMSGTPPAAGRACCRR
jgi:hypothetical protein